MPKFNLTWSDFAALAALLVAVSGSNFLTNKAQLETVEARLNGQMLLSSQTAQGDRDSLREDFSSLSSEISALVKTGLEARTDEVVFALSRLRETSDALTVKISNVPVFSDAFVDFEQLAMSPGSVGSSYRFGGVAYGSIQLTDLQDEAAFEVQRIVDAVQAEYDNVQVALELSPDSLVPNSRLSAQLIEQQIESLTGLLETIRSERR